MARRGSSNAGGAAIALVVSLAGLALGCDGRRAAAREAGARDLDCPLESVVVKPVDEGDPASGRRLVATGCGRSEVYDCYNGVRHYGASCMRLAPPRVDQVPRGIPLPPPRPSPPSPFRP